MSGMSGLELLPKAKAVRPDVPIIMITAYGDPETKRQAFENGAEALLTKPIDSRRCAVRSTAAPRAPHSRSKFPEFVALHESLDGTFRTWPDVRLESAFGGRADVICSERVFPVLTAGTDIRPLLDLCGKVLTIG